MNFKPYIYAFLMTILFGLKTTAQQTHGGIPYSLYVNSTDTVEASYRAVNQNLVSVTLPSYDNAALKQSADSLSNSCPTCHSKYYGKVMAQTIDLIASGTYQLIDNIKVYRYKFSSSTAMALQFYFSKFNLPEKGSLYFYNSDKTLFFGALTSDYSSTVTTGEIVMATAPLTGGDWIMEYDEPVDADFTAQIEINNVLHVFDTPSFQNLTTTPNGCQIDVNCELGEDWETERNSTVMISSLGVNYAGYSTGNLINTTNNSEGLYVLSAGHNFQNASGTSTHQPGSLFFIYKYQKTGCDNDGTFQNYNAIYSSYSATIKKIHYDGTAYDYCLLELGRVSKETLRKWDVCYAGWDNSDDLDPAAHPYTMIHHAQGHEKKISQTEDELLESVNHVTDTQTDDDAGFYRGVWEEGTAGFASVGASLFDNNHKIVGTYVGGNGACVNETYNDEPDMFSKFSKSYKDNSQNYSLAFWLDPTNSGANSCDSYCPPEGSDDPDAGDGEGLTVNFAVNGKETPAGSLIQVCASNVILDPDGGLWLFHQFDEQRLCSNIDNPQSAAQNQQSCAFDICRCHSVFDQLFISIQECDYNFNLIGTEHSEWKFFFDGNIDTHDEINIANVDLNIYAPQGFHMQDGKYYQIKIGTTDMSVSPAQWHSHTAHVKTVGQDLSISNQNMTSNQIALNTIHIANSTAPVTSPAIDVVAGTSIKISDLTDLKSGHYYIHTEDCQSLTNFRTNNSNSGKGSSGENTSSHSTTSSKSNYKSPVSSRKNEKELIMPNPNDGNFTVAAINATDVLQSIEIQNAIGITIQSIPVQRASEIYVNIQDQPAGLYFVKLNYADKTVTKKVVKQ